MDYFALCVDITRAYQKGLAMPRHDRLNPLDMPSGDGKAQMMTLTCATCEWVIRASPTTAVSGAVRHGEETGHQILYKGHPQQFHGTKD